MVGLYAAVIRIRYRDVCRLLSVPARARSSDARAWAHPVAVQVTDVEPKRERANGKTKAMVHRGSARQVLCGKSIHHSVCGWRHLVHGMHMGFYADKGRGLTVRNR